MPQIIRTAEPFFFPGEGKNARIGCLVTHGFTGAPKEMRWLGEYLHRQGYTVCGVRLAGHATRPADMVRSRWQDWLLSLEDGYALLRSCTEQVCLLGLSMGGVLSLAAAARLLLYVCACAEKPLLVLVLPEEKINHYTQVLQQMSIAVTSFRLEEDRIIFPDLGKIRLDQNPQL